MKASYRSSFRLRRSLAAATLAAALGAAVAAAAAAGEPVPLGPLGPAVTPAFYDLHLKIDPREERFYGEVAISVHLADATDTIYLHGKRLNVASAVLETPRGERIAATYDEVHPTGVARLKLAKVVPKGDSTLKVVYDGPFDRSLDGLYRVERGGKFYALSQFQPIAARKAFPSFDEPRFKVPFRTTITSRKEDVVATTMPQKSIQDRGDGFVTRTFEVTPPLPTYLIAFVVGPYDLVVHPPIPSSKARDSRVPLRGLATAGQGGMLGAALKGTTDLVPVLEDYFGVALRYPKLDVIAAPEFSAGAMENVGAITFLERNLLLRVDAPFSQRRSFTEVLAHELAHQWFGNLVTPAWWDDIWLNESFASWMAAKAAQAYWPEGFFEHEILLAGLSAMESDSLASARRIREPVASAATVEDAFDRITYRKGGAVLQMFETFLGKEAFQKGIQLHLRRFYDGVATVDDFTESLGQATDRKEAVPAFRSFIDQPGVPLIEATVDCVHARAHVAVRQRRYAPLGSRVDRARTWTLPVCLHHDGTTTCKVVSAAEDVIQLPTEGCPTFVHPNAGGSGYYRFTFGDESGWEALRARAHRLEPEEALTYADSLAAAFVAGDAQSSVALRGLIALAAHPSSDVVSATAEHLRGFAGLLNGRTGDKAKALFAAAFRPRYQSIPAMATGRDLLLKTSLARVLALDFEDAALRSVMVQQARRIIGFGAKRDPEAAERDLYESVLSVGVQDLGALFFDSLLAEGKSSNDPIFLFQVAGALSRTKDPELSKKVQAEFLADTFPARARLAMLFDQLRQEETRGPTWRFIKEDFDAFLNAIPETRRARATANVNAFCQAEPAEEFSALVKARASQLIGYERSLAQGMEQVDLCMALRSAKARELAAAVNALHDGPGHPDDDPERAPPAPRDRAGP